MKYQVVLQIPASHVDDFDRMIFIEDVLIDRFGDSHDVDSHDCGCGKIHTFILTNDVEDVFQKAKPLFEESGLLSHLKAAWRAIDSQDYTLLRPVGLKTFKIN